MKTLKPIILFLALIMISCKGNNNKEQTSSTADIPVSREMMAELTSPPNVPTPVGRRKAKKLIVNMEILEQEGELTGGVKYMYWTFVTPHQMCVKWKLMKMLNCSTLSKMPYADSIVPDQPAQPHRLILELHCLFKCKIG